MLLPFHAVVVCSICGRACWIHAWVVAPAWHIQRIPRYPFVRAFCRPPGAWHADGWYGRIILPIGTTQRTRGTYAPRLPRRPTTPGETLRPLRLAWAVWSTAPPPSSAGVLARVWRLSATRTEQRARGPPWRSPKQPCGRWVAGVPVGCGSPWATDARRLSAPVGCCVPEGGAPVGCAPVGCGRP